MVENIAELAEFSFDTSYYRTIQNFGGRKFWQNSSHQKLAETILVNAQSNKYALTLAGQIES